jgi:hypothetical protein
MWAKIAASLIALLARLLAGPIAARAAGKSEEVARQSAEQRKSLDEQADIAARPHASRDELLERMRNGDL